MAIKPVAQLVEEANAVVQHIPAAQAAQLLTHDDVTFVDLRDIRELKREGRIPGAMHCPRGMLEFWLDPASPYAKPEFQSGGTFLFFCAMGWRSALSAKTAQDMGLDGVMHIEDGFKGWVAARAPVETD